MERDRVTRERGKNSLCAIRLSWHILSVARVSHLIALKGKKKKKKKKVIFLRLSISNSLLLTLFPKPIPQFPTSTLPFIMEIKSVKFGLCVCVCVCVCVCERERERERQRGCL